MTKISFELPAVDLERAKSFYQQVFDWQMNDLPGMEYTLVLDTATVGAGQPDGILGGIAKRTDLVSSVVPIISVRSLESCLERALIAGATLLEPKSQVGDFGLSCYIRDTEGNTLCLWQELG